MDYYLDDFITMGHAGMEVCCRNLALIQAACRDLGVKLEGPTHCLNFHGNEIDTHTGMLH